MDALPVGLRGKILDLIEVDDEGHVTQIHRELASTGKVKWYMYVLWLASFVFAIPFVLLGALVCLTLIGIPIGIAIIGIGCLPLSTVTGRMVLQKNR